MSGIGRGRGWLNINKTMPTKPGLPSPVETALIHDFNPATSTVSPTSPIMLNPKHANIISKISLFNDSDEGILMNQKIKHIIEEFHKDCLNAQEVDEAFLSIHENCLNDVEFATKAISMASKASFNTVHVHGVKIRNLFIGQFQKDFEGSKQMQANNPSAFRNSVKMLGDFYHKARLIDGQPFKFLSAPMVKYLDMLLESSFEQDLQLFTVQLYMNGNGIKDELPSKLNDLLVQVRNMLAHNDRLTSISKLWLMLAIDISNNRYNILPNDLNQFYVTQLGDAVMLLIKKNNMELSIQTSYHNISLDSIHSNVNVLQQVSNTTSSNTTTSDSGWESPPLHDTDKPNLTSMNNDLPHQHTTKYPTKPRSTPSTNNYKNPDVGFNHIGTWEQPKNEKTPRPILGAGVRLKHAENKSAEDAANWRDRKTENNEWKENTSISWGDNKKGSSGSGWNSGGPTKPRNKNAGKGWEHDDRFENEY